MEERHLGEAERCTHREDPEQHNVKWRKLPLTNELPRKDLGKADQRAPGS